MNSARLKTSQLDKRQEDSSGQAGGNADYQLGALLEYVQNHHPGPIAEH